MEDKILEVFNKYSNSVHTEYNVYNCLIEEDWLNIAQELVKLFRQPDVVGISEQLVCDCNVKLAETTLQVYCPKCYKTHKMK